MSKNDKKSLPTVRLMCYPQSTSCVTHNPPLPTSRGRPKNKNNNEKSKLITGFAKIIC